MYKAIYDAIAGNGEGKHFVDNNRRAYTELVKFLDERFLQLVIHDTDNKCRAAFWILKEHYASTEKPRILSLYKELTTLKMTTEGDATDYLICVELAATGLRKAGEVITDNLVIAMMLKVYKNF